MKGRIAAAALAALTACGGGSSGSSGNSGTSGSSGTPSGGSSGATHTGSYTVIASGSASVTYQVPGGQLLAQATAPPNGWSQSFTCHAGDFLSVSAAGIGAGAKVEVLINIDGLPIAGNIMGGGNPIADAVARCPS